MLKKHYDNKDSNYMNVAAYDALQKTNIPESDARKVAIGIVNNNEHSCSSEKNEREKVLIRKPSFVVQTLLSKKAKIMK